MGQKESVDHHILLYGQSQHGKTNFLYDNFLNGKWDEEQRNIESSLGYNYELIQTQSEQKYGVWDISGNPEDLFIKTIPFSGILYIIRPKYKQGYLVEDKLKEIGTARQQIHYLANHRYFNNKFLLVILNINNIQDLLILLIFYDLKKIEEEQLTANGSDDVSQEQLDLVIDEMKELIKYEQITISAKDMVIIDRGSAYTKLWEKVGKLISDCKKQK